MHGRPVHQDLSESSPSHPNRWRILGVLVLALLVTSIDHTIINVALPQIVVDLDASAAQLQWIVAAYTVVFAGLLLTAGSLGDRFGRRHALAAGLAHLHGRLDPQRPRRHRHDAHRRPRRHGPRRGAHHADDAVDHRQLLRRPA